MFDFLSKKFFGILSWLKDRGRLTEENISQALDQVRSALLEADVPLEIAETFLKLIKDDTIGEKINSTLNPGQQLIKIVHKRLLEFLGGANTLDHVTYAIPSVIMVMGLQGSGKTTTIAKLAYQVQKQAQQRGKHRKILFASVDFYRPAAIDQLEILAQKTGVDFYKSPYSDPIRTSQDTLEYFKKNLYELLFLDTAGRLHVDIDMMKELSEINKKITPKYKYLVLDSMTGQESLSVAKSFNDSIGFDGAIITKLDSDTRGGAAFAFRFALKKPIVFVGTGEKTEDLENFVPERMASRILGMGDMLTLIEKAEENISENTSKDLSKRFIEGNFTLKDFAQQLSLIDKMGSFQKISRYLPGVPTVSQDQMEKGQIEIKKFRAIISSMTQKECIIPNILDASRKKRIAQGSGTSVQEINQLLQRFEQSKQFVKLFKNNKFKRFL
jgi:signal recognition particle subunit SRP54